MTDALLSSKYPAYVKIHGCHLQADFILKNRTRIQDDVGPDLSRLGQTCLKLLPDALGETPADSATRWEIVRNTYLLITNFNSSLVAYNKVAPLVATACPDSYIGPLLEAFYYSRAKRPMWIPDDEEDVRRAQAQTKELLDKFRASSLRAWQRSHACTLACDYLLNIAETDEEFDLWYQRATEEQPDNYFAENFKLGRLLRLGRETEAHDFALTCADHDNLSTGITLILPIYHYEVGCEKGVPKPGYFTDPAVFAEIQGVYERFLAEFPEAVTQLCAYARLACWAEHWEVANAQFAKLGDRFDPAIFPGKQQYDYMRRKVAQHLKPAP